jgi:nucleoid DNA-binding protein
MAVRDEIAAAASHGDQVELRGFRAFSITHRFAQPAHRRDNARVEEKHIPSSNWQATRGYEARP